MQFFYHSSETTPTVVIAYIIFIIIAELSSTTFFKTHIMEIHDINFLLYFLVLFLFNIHFYEMLASKLFNKYFVVI